MKTIIKKIISISLAVVMLLSLAACGEESDVKETLITENVKVEGAIFSGQDENAIELSLSFAPEWLTRGDNTVYNSKLAACCVLLSTNVYFREKDIAKGIVNRVVLADKTGEYAPSDLLESLGFSDIKSVDSYKDGKDTVDTNSSTVLQMGYQNVDGKDVFVVAVRGCYSAGEYRAVFSIGSTSSEFEKLTGSHPEWTNKNLSMDFNISATRAKKYIDEYIKSHDDANAENVILLTGNSRGGAVANILGAQYEKDETITSYTYTFSATPCTLDSDAASYTTIFNLYDASDLYANLFQYADEKFVRYGKDITYNMYANQEAKAKRDELVENLSYTALSSSKIEEYNKLFQAKYKDRDSIFEQRTITKEFKNKKDAQAYYNQIKEYISADAGLGLEKYVTLNEVKKISKKKYEVSYTYYVAAEFEAYSQILAYGDVALDAYKELFSDDEDALAVAKFYANNLDLIKSTHLFLNAYILSQYVGQ